MQTETPQHHRLSVPDHKPVRIGTLNAILRQVAAANAILRQVAAAKGVAREALLATLS